MWGASARARVHAPFPYLANGAMDCIQIWCVSSRIHYIITLDKCGTHVWGGVHLHMRTCTPRFPDLANGWADCVQILCVNRDPLDNCFAHVWCGLHLHVRTCTPRFPYLAKAGRIASKFGEWLGIHDGRVLHMSEAGLHLCARTCRSLFNTGNTNNQPSVRSATPKALPRRSPKVGWTWRQQLFVRIVVFSMRNQPELSK